MGLMEELDQNISQADVSYISKAIQPTFGWDTAVGYLTFCADSEFGEPVSILFYKLPGAERIDSIQPVKEYLSENITPEILGADLFVSFSTKKDAVMTSKNNTLLWNVLGYSIFEINGETREVEPGDLIYIPKNVEYKLARQTATCFVLFSLGENYDN